MARANQELRQYAKIKKVSFWQVAEAMGICEATMTRWLRHELPEEKRTEIKNIINRLTEIKAENL